MPEKRDRKLARAYIRGQKDIDAFLRREAAAQSREITINRELEWHKARRLQQSSESAAEIVDGEFREVGE